MAGGRGWEVGANPEGPPPTHGARGGPRQRAFEQPLVEEGSAHVRGGRADELAHLDLLAAREDLQADEVADDERHRRAEEEGDHRQQAVAEAHPLPQAPPPLEVGHHLLPPPPAPPPLPPPPPP